MKKSSLPENGSNCNFTGSIPSVFTFSVLFPQDDDDDEGEHIIAFAEESDPGKGDSNKSKNTIDSRISAHRFLFEYTYNAKISILSQVLEESEKCSANGVR